MVSLKQCAQLQLDRELRTQEDSSSTIKKDPT